MVKNNNDKWGALSMSERASLINIYMQNGVLDLKKMREHYNGIPYKDFNTSEYDYFGAHPDNAPTKEGEHWTSRNPVTGQLLKREDHPTYNLMVEGEKKAGYNIHKGLDGNLYSKPNEPTNYVEYNSFDDGGDILYYDDTDIEPAIVTAEYPSKKNVLEDAYKYAIVADALEEEEKKNKEEHSNISVYPNINSKALHPEILKDVYSLYYPNTSIGIQVNTNNRYNNGGRILSGEEDNKPLFDPQKIVDNVSAREFGPQKVMGENDFLVMPGSDIIKAPIQYLANQNTGKKNIEFANQIIKDFESLKDKQHHIETNSDTYKSYLDAIHYLDHVEALKKYLGLPYDTNVIKESEYKPTRLQGTDVKTYKFTSEENPKYWEPVVESMIISNSKENQYIDPTLNTFTAYRDMDDKGEFISVYDEWDYNPAVKGGWKPLGKIIDKATGGEPFVVYDRIYLDDYFDIPEEARGNPYIKPAILTDTNAFMEVDYKNGGKLNLNALGGPLYNKHNPIESFSGSSKIPVVRKSLTRR